jgi:hypothetical protein
MGDHEELGYEASGAKASELRDSKESHDETDEKVGGTGHRERIGANALQQVGHGAPVDGSWPGEALRQCRCEPIRKVRHAPQRIRQRRNGHAESRQWIQELCLVLWNLAFPLSVECNQVRSLGVLLFDDLNALATPFESFDEARQKNTTGSVDMLEISQTQIDVRASFELTFRRLQLTFDRRHIFQTEMAGKGQASPVAI